MLYLSDKDESDLIFGVQNDVNFHQLSMSWDVFPVLARNQTEESELFRHAVDCAKIVSEGDRVVITSGMPLNIEGATNLLKVEVVGKSVR